MPGDLTIRDIPARMPAPPPEPHPTPTPQRPAWLPPQGRPVPAEAPAPTRQPATMPLRWFLFVNRLPAIDKALCYGNGVDPKLFATLDGKRVRVVMASRMGDVGVTENLEAEYGYSRRVDVGELTDFSDKP